MNPNKLTDAEAVAGLENSSAKKQTMDVTDLKPLDRVQILGLEAETKAIACVLGWWASWLL